MRGAVLLVLGVLGAFGQPETFDLATFAVPAGWTRLPGQGSAGFRSADGGGQIFVFPSRVSSGLPEENFRADWARLVTPVLGNMPVPAMQREQRNDGWTGVSGGGTKGQGFAVVLFTATGQGRSVSVVTSVAGTTQVGAIRTFFESLRFGVGSPPASSGGSLSGLYYYVQAGLAGGSRVEVRTRFFLPGNRITRTFPFGDGGTFDDSRCNPDRCGTYALEAGGLRVRWDNGQTDRWAFQTVADGVELDGTRFRRARGLTPAAMAGTWSNAEGNVYRFLPDGTFTFGTSQRAEGGRYSVQGLALSLVFSDGTQRRRALFVASPSDPPGMICVEGEAFARR